MKVYRLWDEEEEAPGGQVYIDPFQVMIAQEAVRPGYTDMENVTIITFKNGKEIVIHGHLVRNIAADRMGADEHAT
jgi:hypothetical protein